MISDVVRMEPIPVRFATEVSMGNAIRAVLHAKTMGNFRPRYIQSLRCYLNAFSRGREDVPIRAVDVFMIEAWFNSRTEATSTMASNIGRLAALFSFCERRGWIDKNPTAFLERPRLDRGPVRILSPDQSGKLISYVRKEKPHALAYFTLALFAGVRPEEMEKIHWEKIDLSRKVLTVDATASKVRRRRIVELHPTAVHLLTEAVGVGRLPIGRESRRRFLGWASDHLEFDGWPQDCMRHSAASYMLAIHDDSAKVARWLGNSVSILLRDYHELVSKETAEKFWTI